LLHVSYYEDMYVQAVEHFPGIIVDVENQRISFDSARFTAELAEYSQKMADTATFTLTDEYSAVYHRFLAEDLNSYPAIRGQLIGPVSFGFKLVEPEKGTPHRVRGPISLLASLISTMAEAHDVRYIEDAQFVRTIPIPTLGVGTTEFDITKEKSEALYQSGKQAAEKFFATWDFADYIDKYRRGKSRPERGVRLRS